MRYHLHAGIGRPWNTDPALLEHRVESGDDWKELKLKATRLQDKYDWWQIYDEDDGMGFICSWSTGRTTPHLVEALHAHPVSRHART